MDIGFRHEFRCLLAILAVPLSGNCQYQWTCRGPNFPPYNGMPWEGSHNVFYASYIPVDHVDGPVLSPCFNIPAGPVQKKYKGDPNAIIYGFPPQSWRTSSIFTFRILDNYQGPFWRDPMETRNYGFGSPVNGSFLSALDEDNIPGDCFVWNAKGLADNSDWRYEYTVPFSTQGHVRFVGTGSNPLELPSPGIAWDMRTIIDISNLDHITAKVNYNHTCYPAHVVMVNNFVVYNYRPPRDDANYIFGCLALQQGKVVNEQPNPTRVPCN
jgi:hypothetical protein